MQLIRQPPSRVGANVFPNIGQFLVSPHNMIVEIALPQGRTRDQASVDGQLGNSRLVRLDQRRNGPGNGLGILSGHPALARFGENPQHGVTMIGHDHKGINGNIGMPLGQIQPGLMGNQAQGVQLHDTIHNLAEQGVAFVRTNGDEIRTGPGVIMVRMAQGIPPPFHG